MFYNQKIPSLAIAAYIFFLGQALGLDFLESLARKEERHLLETIGGYRYSLPPAPHEGYSGRLIKKHENGQVKYEVEFANGNVSGKFTKWSKGGRKICERSVDGVEICYGKNGEKLRTFWQKGYGALVEIEKKLYDDNGNIKSREFQKIITGSPMKDKKTQIFPAKVLTFSSRTIFSNYRTYFKNGNPKWEIMEINGKRKTTLYWHKNGKLKGYFHLGNDKKKDGLEFLWHSNGNPAAVNFYKNGEYHGMRTEWREDGSINYQGEFLEGRKIGIHKELVEVPGKLIEVKRKMIELEYPKIPIRSDPSVPKENEKLFGDAKEEMDRRFWINDNWDLKVLKDFLLNHPHKNRILNFDPGGPRTISYAFIIYVLIEIEKKSEKREFSMWLYEKRESLGIPKNPYTLKNYLKRGGLESPWSSGIPGL